MTDVKRHTVAAVTVSRAMRGETDEVVLATAYDALLARVAELEAERARWSDRAVRMADERDAAVAKVAELEADAARYRWLRDGNAYAPEEDCVRGWEELDALCDCGIELAATKETTK